MISHTKVYPFKCNDCERKFRRNSELKQHVCKCGQRKGRIFRASGTNKTNKTEEQVCEVMETAENESEPVKIGETDLSNTIPLSSKVQTKATRRTSLNKCNASKVKKHGCDLCGKHFLSIWHLEENVCMMTHTKIYPFKCDDCERKFRRNSELKQHVRKCRQGMGRIFTAGGTNKTKKRKEQLCEVMKTAENESEPFKIGETDLSNTIPLSSKVQTKATRRTSLNKRNASKVKKHGCDLCGKHFLYMCNLKNI